MTKKIQFLIEYEGDEPFTLKELEDILAENGLDEGGICIVREIKSPVDLEKVC